MIWDGHWETVGNVCVASNEHLDYKLSYSARLAFSFRWSDPDEWFLAACRGEEKAPGHERLLVYSAEGARRAYCPENWTCG